MKSGENPQSITERLALLKKLFTKRLSLIKAKFSEGIFAESYNKKTTREDWERDEGESVYFNNANPFKHDQLMLMPNILDTIKDSLPNTDPLIIEYIQNYAHQNGFMARSETLTKGLLLDHLQNNDKAISFESVKKRYDFIENRDGSVTFIERFYMGNFKDLTDDTNYEGYEDIKNESYTKDANYKNDKNIANKSQIDEDEDLLSPRIETVIKYADDIIKDDSSSAKVINVNTENVRPIMIGVTTSTIFLKNGNIKHELSSDKIILVDRKECSKILMHEKFNKIAKSKTEPLIDADDTLYVWITEDEGMQKLNVSWKQDEDLIQEKTFDAKEVNFIIDRLGLFENDTEILLDDDLIIDIADICGCPQLLDEKRGTLEIAYDSTAQELDAKLDNEIAVQVATNKEIQRVAAKTLEEISGNKIDVSFDDQYEGKDKGKEALKRPISHQQNETNERSFLDEEDLPFTSEAYRNPFKVALEKLVQALDDTDTLQQSWPLSYSSFYSEEINSERLMQAITVPQKQLLIIEMIVKTIIKLSRNDYSQLTEGIQKFEQIKKNLKIPELNDHNLRSKVNNLIPQIKFIAKFDITGFDLLDVSPVIPSSESGFVNSFKNKYIKSLQEYISDHQKFGFTFLKFKIQSLSSDYSKQVSERLTRANLLLQSLETASSVQDIRDIVNAANVYRESSLSETNSKLIHIIGAMDHDSRLYGLEEKKQIDDNEIINELQTKLKFNLDSYKIYKEIDSASRIRSINVNTLEEWLVIVEAEIKNQPDYYVQDALKATLQFAKDQFRVPLPIKSELRKYVRPLVDDLLHYANDRSYSLSYFLDQQNKDKSNDITNDIEPTARIQMAGKLAHALLKCTNKEDLKLIQEEARLFYSKLKSNNINSSMLRILDRIQNIPAKFLSKLPGKEVKDVNEIYQSVFANSNSLSNSKKTALFTTAESLTTLSEYEEKTDQFKARQCAMANIMSHSKISVEKNIGKKLIEEITPGVIEHYRRTYPAYYYAQLFIANLDNLIINQNPSVKVYLQQFILNLMKDFPNDLSMEQLKDTLHTKQFITQVDIPKSRGIFTKPGQANKIRLFIDSFISKLPTDIVIDAVNEKTQKKII